MAHVLKDLHISTDLDDLFGGVSALSDYYKKSETSSAGQLDIQIQNIQIQLQTLSNLIEYWHGMPYAVNGEQVNTLREAIQLINSSGEDTNRLELRKDTVISEKDTGVLPTLTKNVNFFGKGNKLTIGNVTGGDGVAFHIGSGVSASFKDTNFIFRDGTAIDAVSSNVSILACSFSGSQDRAFVTLQSGADCTMISCEAGACNTVVEQLNGGANCNVKNCVFTGIAGKQMLKGSSTSGTAKFTLDGGTYRNFSYSPLGDGMKVTATFTGTDEYLSSIVSSYYTFDSSIAEEFALSVADKSLSKWQVTQTSGNADYTFKYNYPKEIPALENLLAIRARVLSGDSCDGERFIQLTDIDMSKLEEHARATGTYPLSCGNLWDGIGDIGNGDGQPETMKFFKGEYDGNGHCISNLMFFIDPAKNNEEMGLFRCVDDGKIKNLDVYLKGNAFDETSPDISTTHGVGAIVGYTRNGIELQNINVYGQIGSPEWPASHTAAGLVAYVGEPSIDYNKIRHNQCLNKFLSCTNNCDIHGNRKVAGIVGFIQHDATMRDIVNNGDVTRYRHPTKFTSEDAVGGIIGYGQNNKGYEIKYDLSNVTNNGMLSCVPEWSYYSTRIGQVAGRVAADTPQPLSLAISCQHSIENVKIVSCDVPAFPYTDSLNLSGCNVSYAKDLSNGMLMLTNPEGMIYPDSTYKVVSRNYGIDKQTGAKYQLENIVLNLNEAVIVDESIDHANVIDVNNEPVTNKTLVEGTLSTYLYRQQ